MATKLSIEEYSGSSQKTKKTKYPEQTKQQEKPWNEGAPFVIMLAVGTLDDLPEAFKKIEETIKEHSGRSSTRHFVGMPEVVPIQNEGKQASETGKNEGTSKTGKSEGTSTKQTGKSEEASEIHSTRRTVVIPVQSEEEQAMKIVGKEISRTSEELQDLLLGSNTKEQWRHLTDAVIRFTSTIYSDVINVAEGMPGTEALAQTFESALDVFSVPVAEQNAAQLTVTFLKLAVFCMSVIGLGKQCLENPSMTRIASVVLTVGSVMFKIANKHDLYEWIKDNGGMSGLHVRICDYIRQLRSGHNTVPDSYSNTVAIPWPSNNTIILFGTLTVFVASCAYYVYKNR